MKRSKRTSAPDNNLENAGASVEIASENAAIGQEIPRTRERSRKIQAPLGEFLPRARVGKLLTVTDWLREYGKVYRAVRRGHISTQDGSRLAYMCVSGKQMAEALQQLSELAALREWVNTSRAQRGEAPLFFAGLPDGSGANSGVTP